MTIQTRTTELEAVNTILSTIGEAPLSTLTGSLPVDGTMAKSVLNEINREVLKILSKNCNLICKKNEYIIG